MSRNALFRRAAAAAIAVTPTTGTRRAPAPGKTLRIPAAYRKPLDGLIVASVALFWSVDRK